MRLEPTDSHCTITRLAQDVALFEGLLARLNQMPAKPSLV